MYQFQIEMLKDSHVRGVWLTKMGHFWLNTAFFKWGGVKHALYVIIYCSTQPKPKPSQAEAEMALYSLIVALGHFWINTAFCKCGGGEACTIWADWP